MSSEDGAGFASREQPELIRSKHVAFRPIDVKQGPDGAIYIADWYNPIIQHGEVDFRDPRRDHTHGRIWRHDGQGSSAGYPAAAYRAYDDRIARAHRVARKLDAAIRQADARRAGRKVLPDLSAWLAALDAPRARPRTSTGRRPVDVSGTRRGRARAAPSGCWPPKIRMPGRRRSACWARGTSNLPDALGRRSRPLVADEIAACPARSGRGADAARDTAKAVQVAMRALDRPRDRFLDHALYLAGPQPASRLAAGAGTRTNRFRRRSAASGFALLSAESAAAVAPLASLMRSGKLPADQQPAALALLMRFGGPAELSLVFDERAGHGCQSPHAPSCSPAWSRRLASARFGPTAIWDG